MGTGNYWHADGETVILDLYDGIFEQADEDADLASILMRETFDDFQADLAGVLAGTTFRMDGKSWRRDSRNCLILAENGLYQIWSHEDSYGNFFLTYGISERVDDAMEPVARHHLETRAAAVFDRLEELHPLRVATSAWTSGPRRSQAMAA